MMLSVTGPFWGDYTYEREIPLANGQQYRNHFHVLTSAGMKKRECTQLVRISENLHGAGYNCRSWYLFSLTHWGRLTHICVSKPAIIVSDNTHWFSHHLDQCWNMFDGAMGTSFSEILIKIYTFLLNKIHLKMSSAKSWVFFSASMSWMVNVKSQYQPNVKKYLLHKTLYYIPNNLPISK